MHKIFLTEKPRYSIPNIWFMQKERVENSTGPGVVEESLEKDERGKDLIRFCSLCLV